jgi:5'-nucleotidase
VAPVKILLTNDDGILAPGLRLLREALRAAGHDVVVVAPDREQSASSHSITLHRPLRIRAVEDGLHTVDGTPTDCVLVGCHAVLDSDPDLVVSGINHGPNMGEDVTYSGTVAAAFESHILGIPAIAASMKDRETGDYEGAAEVVARLAGRFAEWAGTRRAILNVNFPPGPAASWADPVVTRLGSRSYSDEIIEKRDPRGRKYYWIGGAEPEWAGGEDTDFAAVNRGAISVTPLHLDLTDETALRELTTLDLTGVAP